MRRERQEQMDERALARLLDTATAPEPRPGLATRIVASAPRPGPAWWPFAAVWQPLGGLAAAALLGIVVGVTLPAPSVAETDEPATWTAPDWAEPSL